MVHNGLTNDRGAHLLEANQSLVLAILTAETIAETATNNLTALTRSSRQDTLTQTANLELMLERMNAVMDAARMDEKHFAVLFFDLDHFRRVNNSFGHPGGDEALKLVARRLELVLPNSAIVSRHGGDEFLILLTDVTFPSEVAIVAKQILSAIAAPISIGNQVLQLSASIGIAIYPEDGGNVTTLVDNADVAMFRAKQNSPGEFRFHEPELAVDGSSRLPKQDDLTVKSFASNDQFASEIRISDLREANERLMLAALSSQELEELAQGAHRQQIQFMAMVAHELRSPLTPIRLATSLLLDRHSQDESTTRLKLIIDSQVSHMSRLIGDLLDGSRISTGKLRLERVAVEIVSILNSALETFRPAMEARNQRFRSLIPEGPVLFNGDAVRLAQIFTNLLDNASKYTPQGGSITMTMTMSEYDIAIAIIDDGVGISPEALPHIFDLFVQDTPALAHSKGGFGIGLAVVRDLVQAHDGNVTGHSEGRNLGSEFIVTLPITAGIQSAF